MKRMKRFNELHLHFTYMPILKKLWICDDIVWNEEKDTEFGNIHDYIQLTNRGWNKIIRAESVYYNKEDEKWIGINLFLPKNT